MKKILGKLSVRGKIYLIISLNLIFLVLISAIAYIGLTKMDTVKDDITDIGVILQHQLTADMMHDALRADCYNALLTDTTDAAAQEAVRTDLKEHVDIFNEQIAALNKLKLSAEVGAAVKEVEGPLNNYVKTCQELVDLGLNRGKDSTSATKIAVINETFKKVFDDLAVSMENMSELIAADAQKAQVYGEEYGIRIKTIMIVLLFFVCLIAIVVSNIISKTITKPVQDTHLVLTKLSAGENADELEVESKDELGQMIGSINAIVSNLNHVKEYVSEVGKGNFETNITIFNNNGEIYSSLSKMKESLKHTAEEDKKRNWTTEGLAKFADILRANTDDVNKFYDSIISNLVKYMGANQGGMYILNEDISKNKFLELTSCYAFQKKKYVSKRIEVGEGLVGQCVLEGDTIYMTDVPEEYIEITSGLGDAPPRCILIVPLKVNDVNYGVVELAAFAPFEQFKIEFVQKVGESIASTVSAVKVNAETRHLLQISQQQSEEMRAQEEEMRQNLEEMQATQEEMQRKEFAMKETLERAQQQEEEIRQNMEEMQAIQEEMERKEKEFKRQVENREKDMAEQIRLKTLELKVREDVFTLTTILSESDTRGVVTFANSKLSEVSKYSMDEIIGKPHNMFRHPDMPKELFKLFWDTIKSGKVFKGIVKNRAKDGSHYWVDACIVPVKDETGSIVKYIGARYHIVDDVMALKLYNDQAKKLGFPLLEK